MSIYADFAPRRARQIVADIVALAIIVGAILLGIVVHGTIAALGGVFVKLQDAGTGFEGTMGEIGDRLGEVPLIGGGIRGPFDTAAGAGGSLADAGRAGQATVEALASIVGVTVALIPILVLALAWLWPRVRFVRRARETRALLRLDDGLSLLALRALDDATARELARISPRALSDWRAGEPAAVRALAALEARRAGVRVHAAAPRRADASGAPR